MQQDVSVILGLIAFVNTDITQLLKWLLSKLGATPEGWGAVILSYVSAILTCLILYALGLLPGIAWWSAILWAIVAAFVSNGVYKARTLSNNS